MPPSLAVFYRDDERAPIDSLLPGNVLTATGQTVDKGAVSLINGVDTGPDYVALVKKDGSFRFERVAPGEYHLISKRDERSARGVRRSLCA